MGMQHIDVGANCALTPAPHCCTEIITSILQGQRAPFGREGTAPFAFRQMFSVPTPDCLHSVSRCIQNVSVEKEGLLSAKPRVRNTDLRIWFAIGLPALRQAVPEN